MKELAWHTVTPERALTELNSDSEGLSWADATGRLASYGPNRVGRSRRDGPVRILLRQLTTPLIYVLLVSAAAAWFLGKAIDAAVILAVVVINALVGFVQEWQAGEAIEALTRMVPLKATVLREGEPTVLPAEDVVPGDLVLLQAGERVPADLLLLDQDNLHVDEASLTGESVPVAKQVGPVSEDAAVGDRLSMTFGGTFVTAGTATALVVATGNRTELGRISELLADTVELETPLTRRLTALALWITSAVGVVAALIVGVGLIRAHPLVDSVLAAITLAVAAIPEGLPAAITIASAIGVRRMARRQAIIRRLPAVETLGSTTVICTDKTGTLTRNEMTVQALWTPDRRYGLSGIGYAPEGVLHDDEQQVSCVPVQVHDLLLASVLCNDASVTQDDDGRWTIVGDPTEAALVVAARKVGDDAEPLRDEWPRVDVIPFDSERQYMATLHATADGRRLMCLKGAPEVVVRWCSGFGDGSALHSERIDEEVHALASRGLRVLAVASAEPPVSLVEFSDHEPPAGLRFLGLMGLIDPPRPEALAAIVACRAAGIRVTMVTGDHPSTARAVAAELGLLDTDASGDAVVTGRRMSQAPDVELQDLAQTHRVFARVAPEDKLRLVMALQARGDVVAMTGDGVNDAPALKRANIGVAMGISGTAVAQEAADMVLADDNFASLEAAVEEGRRVYDNLLKSLTFILPTSLGQAMIILVAVMFFPVRDGHLLMPIDPVQILWVNLLVAITLALPLAFEAPEPDLMTRPPRATDAPLLSSFLVVRTVLVAAVMTASAVGLFLFEYSRDIEMGIGHARALAESQTVAVTTIILFQAIYLLNCRSLTESIFRIGLFSNMHVYYGIATALALQACLVYMRPFNVLFHTHPLSATDWIAPSVVALLGLPIVAIEKWFWRRRGRRAPEGPTGN
jgi:magnesium-transporting ATPase (P-type)